MDRLVFSENPKKKQKENLFFFLFHWKHYVQSGNPFWVQVKLKKKREKKKTLFVGRSARRRDGDVNINTELLDDDEPPLIICRVQVK